MESHTEYQTRYYPHAGQRNAYFVLCLDQSCAGRVYVVPKGLNPHYSDYEKLLQFLRKNGLPILPRLNVDLSGMPGSPYIIDAGRFLLEGEVKPTGSFSLKSIHSKSPFSYTPGQLANFKYLNARQINDYLKSWNKVNLLHDSNDGKLSLKVSNSVTNEYYDFDVVYRGRFLGFCRKTRSLDAY